VLEDLVTTGGSVLEVTETLRSEGLVVNDVVVVLDREQGARKLLNDKGLNLHSIFTMSEMLEMLDSENILEKDKVAAIRTFISSNQVTSEPANIPKPVVLTYAQRSAKSSSVITKQLLDIMESKKSNLAVAIDVTKKSELLELAEKVGKEICILKTHIDIIDDFDAYLVSKLQQLAQKHNFLIFEDRKFADIGNTVKYQYSAGVHKISQWAHIVDAHVVPGKGIIDGLKQVGLPLNRGLLLLAEMSSAGSLATGQYTEQAVKLAKENKDFVIGFICQRKLTDDPDLIHMTPGVQLEEGTDQLGQQYSTPQSVILKNESDIIIVGRGIYGEADPEAMAKKYRDAGWSAYLSRVRRTEE